MGATLAGSPAPVNAFSGPRRETRASIAPNEVVNANSRYVLIIDARHPVSAIPATHLDVAMKGAVMPEQPIVRTLGANSFSCPYCDALSHQTWFRPFLDPYKKDSSPTSKAHAGLIVTGISSDPNFQGDAAVIAHWQSSHPSASFDTSTSRFAGFLLSSKMPVSAFASVAAKSLFGYPTISSTRTRSYTFKPHSDMPAELVPDFKEAAEIVDA